MIPRVRLLLVATVGLVACATKGQLRGIETQMMIRDREQERRDSAFQAGLSAILAQNELLLDSLVNTREAINEAKGQSSSETVELRRRLQSLEESQRMANQTIQEFLAQVDAQRSQRIAAPFDSTLADSLGEMPPQQNMASATQMLQAGNSQLNRSAWSTARAAFQELLNTYPMSALVPDALYGIAQSYALTNPDSASAYYREVAENNPDSRRAASAMFKLGDEAQRKGDLAKARSWFQKIQDERYRGTAEYDLAAQRLRQLP